MREDAFDGIDFAQARFYDSVIGRFLSPDTIYDGGLTDPQGLNRYSYVKGHVMSATDPTGHGCGPTSTPTPGTSACDGSGGISGGGIGGSGSGPVVPSAPPTSGGIDLLETAKAVTRGVIGSLLEKVIENVTGVSSGDAINPYADYGVSGTDAGDWKKYVPEKFQGQIADAFDGPITAVKLDKDAVLFRHWGEGSYERGSWYAPNVMSPEDARSYLALPNKNTAQNVTRMKIPAGEIVLVGKVADQASASFAGSYAKGGGKQVWHENFELPKNLGRER